MFRISLTRRVKSKEPTVLVGFQGVGLVGSLSAAYLREKLELEEIGFIDTTSISPLALVVNKEVRFPLRVFEDVKRKVVLFESEMPVQSKFAYELSKQVVAFSKKVNAKQIVCMEGVKAVKKGKEGRLYGTATTDNGKRQLIKKKIDILQNGVIVGITAAIMLEAKSQNVPCVCVMAEAASDLPDGKAAAKIIGGVNRLLYGVNVETKDLLDQAKDFEEKMKVIVSNAKERKVDNKRNILYG